MRSYKELNEELKGIILESKKVPKGSFRFALLRAKATKLHNHLLEADRSVAIFNKRCMFGNYEGAKETLQKAYNELKK